MRYNLTVHLDFRVMVLIFDRLYRYFIVILIGLSHLIQRRRVCLFVNDTLNEDFIIKLVDIIIVGSME